MKYARLAAVMHKIYTWYPMDVIHKNILIYQKNRNLGGVDWEGELEFFRRVVRWCLRRRR